MSTIWPREYLCRHFLQNKPKNPSNVLRKHMDVLWHTLESAHWSMWCVMRPVFMPLLKALLRSQRRAWVILLLNNTDSPVLTGMWYDLQFIMRSIMLGTPAGDSYWCHPLANRCLGSWDCATVNLFNLLWFRASAWCWVGLKSRTHAVPQQLL